jgi:hypothetical protein
MKWKREVKRVLKQKNLTFENAVSWQIQQKVTANQELVEHWKTNT